MAESNYNIQYDAQGRPFFWVNGTVGGAKRYVSPVAMGGEAPEDTTGIFRKRPQWNQDKGEFETPIDWGNILNVGVGSALTAGAANAFMAPAAGATSATSGAAGGLLPNAWQVPANIPWYAGGAGMTGPLGAIVPTTAASVLGGTEAATSGGGGVLSKILKGLIDPKTLTALGMTAGIPLAMKAFGGGGDEGGGNEFFTPEMKRYQAMSEARFRRTDPLHEAVSQLAFQRMPIQSRAGLNLPRVPLPE